MGSIGKNTATQINERINVKHLRWIHFFGLIYISEFQIEFPEDNRGQCDFTYSFHVIMIGALNTYLSTKNIERYSLVINQKMET